MDFSRKSSSERAEMIMVVAIIVFINYTFDVHRNFDGDNWTYIHFTLAPMAHTHIDRTFGIFLLLKIVK